MLKNSKHLLGLGALLLATPADALGGMTAQGMTAQGMTAQGMTAQGMTAQGMTAQGMTAQGMTAQGMTAQGMTAQGMTAQGMTAQGMTAQGMTAQGMTAQGVVMMGTDLVGAELKGVMIKSVDIHGTESTSAKLTHTLTNIPNMSAGPGNYITVGGGSVVGHYAVAHLADAGGTLVSPAEDLDLYIAAQKKDPIPNLFHRFEEQDNEDELYQVFFFHKWSGQWMSLCPYDAKTKMASAMAIPEDPGHPNDFVFACTATGVASKCARNWGYRPWAETTAWVFSGGAWALQTFSLKKYYDVCTAAARAGYCQDPQSYTKDGTLVDLFDTRQIIWPNAIENPFSESNPDSRWMIAQEYFISTGTDTNNLLMQASALQRTRYKELSPAAECGNFAYIDRLEHDHIEDGRWANPLTNTPRIQVFSPTHCTHNEYIEGDPLPWDCTPCTTQVCKTMPECCGAGLTPKWSNLCAQQAVAVCKTGTDQWPKGRVWPAEIDTSGAKILPKFLFGPQGSVMRVEGTSGTGTSATVSGWACDPEWPDSTVAVAIYDAPRETAETPLAVVRADQPLALPLAREVSAACDGPGRTYARHGFSFTLPANQSGNVFVYALDEATADGLPAPPTLIRNGIIQVPRCAHSEHVTGAALDQECSACAASVCGSDETCCATEWTEGCAALANSCAPTDSSAPANSRVFAAVTTGWIEAPSDGLYTFDSSLQRSRLFINGMAVLDWFETSPGTRQGSISLRAGQRYHLRWDRFQAAPPSGGSGPGLTWRPPGAVGQVPIPSANLYAIAPGGGSGLKASYFDDTGYVGTRSNRFVPSPDPYVDINNDVQPPGPKVDLPGTFTAPYSATWEGEVTPSFSEAYTFYVVGSGVSALTIDGAPVPVITPPGNTAPGGCAHDLCEYGGVLDASCNTCVQKICAKDPYCCNGGYLSYYSFDLPWDAKCIAEVNAYCGAGLCSTPPLGSPGPGTKKLGPITLVAGTRYAISLTYDNNTSDKTIRLLWSSARQAKQVIPAFALFPKDPGTGGLGAGLNVTYFGTTTTNNVVSPDLTTVVAAGFATDLSLTPTIGQTGTPLVEVLASPADAAAATPPPPILVRPRYEDRVSAATPNLEVEGIGGLPGGSVRIGLQSDSTVEVIASVNPDGTFTATVPVGSFGAQILKLLQRAPGASCVVPTSGACSYEITWPVVVDEATASTKPPEIFSPSDPTHSGNALNNTFNVIGQGTIAPVHIVDEGSAPNTFTDIMPAADGSFSGSITLTPGDSGDPLKGWHKLIFSQGGTPSPPVFVSVGIDPPTVEFPRNEAELPCDGKDDQTSPPPATGTIPYPVDVRFGPLYVMEETGRQALGDIGAKITILPPAQAGGPQRFEVFYNGAGPGRHVLLFFQAPQLPQGTPQAEIDAHLRAFSSLANTPFSRIAVNIRPRPFQILQRVPTIITPVPGQIPQSITFNVDACDPGAPASSDPRCGLPRADINVRVGERVHTVRAQPNGAWNLTVPLPLGWSAVKMSQVLDSAVGGAWSESCPLKLDYGVQTDRAPVITPPNSRSVEATSPKGAVVFYEEAKAHDVTGVPIPVTCAPASGSTFPLGTTPVLCTATDPNTGAIGLASFFVSVFDGAPTIHVPAGGLTVEATSVLGTLVDFSKDVSATDVVDGPLPVMCAPSSPAQFALDEATLVKCEAADHFGQTAEGTFSVRVVDTTPPDLCELPDIKVASDASGGAIVTYRTCAKDIVDGPVAVVCDPRSGSFFPVGKTKVTCAAVDKHGNKSAPSSFIVEVGDSTPPVLKLPGIVNATATSRNGARVNYTVTATDNVDPNPKVKCTPASGSLFPLGTTPVNCTATDAAGNSSTGGFKVKVTVAWGGRLQPVDGDGSSRFLLGLPIGLRFALTGASANIYDLTAKLFVAPLDAKGKPGAERPAAGLPPGAGNLFYFLPIVNQYAMLLDTRPLSVGPWQLRVDLGDGEIHTERITMYKLF